MIVYITPKCLNSTYKFDSEHCKYFKIILLPKSTPLTISRQIPHNNLRNRIATIKKKSNYCSYGHSVPP